MVENPKFVLKPLKKKIGIEKDVWDKTVINIE
jgi:hypothetical protein